MPNNAMMPGVENGPRDSVGLAFPTCQHDPDIKPEIGVEWAAPVSFNSLDDLMAVFPGMLDTLENRVGDLNENPLNFDYVDLTA